MSAYFSDGDFPVEKPPLKLEGKRKGKIQP